MIAEVVFRPAKSMPLYPTRVATSPWRRIKVSTGETIKLEPQVIQWKGKTLWVGDFELFKMIIKDWMKRYNWSKDQAFDEYFDMSA
jgi:hypothetical protein